MGWAYGSGGCTRSQTCGRGSEYRRFQKSARPLVADEGLLLRRGGAGEEEGGGRRAGRRDEDSAFVLLGLILVGDEGEAGLLREPGARLGLVAGDEVDVDIVYRCAEGISGSIGVRPDQKAPVDRRRGVGMVTGRREWVTPV